MRRQDGFSYAVALFVVAALSVGSLRALEYSTTAERREKEVDLLWTGMAIRNAIAAYHQGSSGSAKAYPTELSELLYADTLSNPTRPLRKVYRDPITGNKEWGLVKQGDFIVGVYSLSQQRPIKQAGFEPELAAFANAQHYSDWKFVYQPAQ